MHALPTAGGARAELHAPQFVPRQPPSALHAAATRIASAHRGYRVRTRLQDVIDERRVEWYLEERSGADHTQSHTQCTPHAVHLPSVHC